MIDRKSKILLAAIAIGLLLNFASPILQPNVVQANPFDDPTTPDALREIKYELERISRNLERIADHFEACGCLH